MPIRFAELQLLERAASQRNSPVSRSVPEWLLRFSLGPPGTPGFFETIAIEHRRSLRVKSVQIVGAVSKSVQSVQIHLGDQNKLQVNTVSDGRTGWIAAGELIEAMAKEFGHEGMTIDLGSLELDPESTSVSVLIAAAEPEVAEKTRVVIAAGTIRASRASAKTGTDDRTSF